MQITRRLVAILVLIAPVLATHAATPIDGWYAEAFGGYANIPGNVYFTTYGVTRSNAIYQAGFDAGGAFGYKSNPMRYAFDVTYLTANLERFQANHILQTGVSGYTNALVGLASFYYDFPSLICTLQPYIGAGIGYAWGHAVLESTGPVGLTHASASENLFAYQGTAGLSYHFSENYSLYVAYRYIATSESAVLGDKYQANLANIGAVWRFDGNNYK